MDLSYEFEPDERLAGHVDLELFVIHHSTIEIELQETLIHRSSVNYYCSGN